MGRVYAEVSAARFEEGGLTWNDMRKSTEEIMELKARMEGLEK